MSVGVAKYLSRYSLVLFVLLSVALVSSIVAADCYVTQADCNDKSPCVASDGCKIIPASEYVPQGLGCFRWFGNNGQINDCFTGCCCDASSPNGVLDSSATRGICKNGALGNTRTFHDDISSAQQCAVACNGLNSNLKFNISGTVYRGSSVLAGMSVTLENGSVSITDSNGKYSFRNLDQGSHSIYVSDGSLCQITRNVNNLNSNRVEDLALNCSLLLVSGRILYNGRGIESALNATYTINSVKNTLQTSSSVNDGSYQFSIPAYSDVNILALSTSGCVGTASATLQNHGQNNLDITINCLKYDLDVSVNDDSGPVNDAIVNVNGQQSAAPVLGVYSFKGVNQVHGGNNNIIVTKTTTVPTASGQVVTSCMNSTILSMFDPVNTYYSVSVGLGSDTCCVDTSTWNTCTTSGFRDVTVIHGGNAARCTHNSVTSKESCNARPACQWDCIVDPANHPWTSCTGGVLQQNRVCSIIDNGGCDTNVPRSDTVRWCNSDCGNGILETSKGEDCDYDKSTGAFNITNECLGKLDDADPLPAGAKWSKQYITDNDEESAVCNPINCQCMVNSAPNVPLCVEDAGKVTVGSRLDPAPMKPAFDITWNMQSSIPDGCADYIDHFELAICNNQTGGCSNANRYYPIDNKISKSLRTYTHDGSSGNPKTLIAPNNKYCYRLTAVFNDSISPKFKKVSDIQCITSGDALCLAYHANSFCLGNLNSSCDATNDLISKACDKTAETCKNSGNNAICSEQAPCDTCNGIFGLFGYQGYRLSSVFGDIACPSIDDPNPTPGFNEVGGCYMDYTKTSVDKAYSCINVTSCYDYMSQSSCEGASGEGDYCGKFTSVVDGVTVDNCAWNPYKNGGADNNAFGKGVCAPKDFSSQQCGLCNDVNSNDGSKNRFGVCTSDICGLYGDCYYLRSNNTCISMAAVSCPIYKTEEECIGANFADDGTKLSSGRNVSADVSWTLINPADLIPPNNIVDSIKSSGTNVLTPSLDGAGFGVCKWDNSRSGTPTSSSKCYRDADNYNNNSKGTQVMDCRLLNQFSADKIFCERDNIPPVTNITTSPLYGIYMDFSGESDGMPKISLNDKIRSTDIATHWSPGDINTNPSGKNPYINMYYCITPISSSCYPNVSMIVSDTKSGSSGDRPYIVNLSRFGIGKANDGQEFRMYYFSEDPAHNLELIKNFSFTVDTMEPNVLLDIKINSYQVSELSWLTDMNATLTLSDNDDGTREEALPVTCTFELIPQDAATIDFFRFSNKYLYNIPSALHTVNTMDYDPGTDTLRTNYSGLIDGEYSYEMRCADSLGNPSTRSGTLKIDGDASINSPVPFGGTFRSDDPRYFRTGAGYGTKGAFVMPISINTSVNGSCRYSTGNKIAFNDMTVFDSDMGNKIGTYHASAVDVMFDDYTSQTYGASGIFRYDVACYLHFNDQNKTIYGTSIDNPYFSIDDIPPLTTLRYMDSASGSYVDYTDSTANLDYAQLLFSCDDSSPLLKTSSGRNTSFGCDDSGAHTYYCIVEPPSASNGNNGNGNDCTDINADFKPASSGPITLDYSDGAIDDKALYGDDPTIRYYSVDNGGNVENFRTTQLRLRNLIFDDPEITVLYNNETANNYFNIIVNYTTESNVNISNFTVLRIVGSGASSYTQEMDFTPVDGVFGQSEYSFDRLYLPNGNYVLTVNSTDDDGNSNDYSYNFTIAHAQNTVYLSEPITGIGTSQGYNIILNTEYPSNCKYSDVDITVCNEPDGKFNCLWNTLAYTTITPIGGSDDLMHLLQYDPSPDLTSGWYDSPFTPSANPAADPRTLYIVCLVEDNTDFSDDSFSSTTLRAGFMTTPPEINMTYITNPDLGPYSNVIINPDNLSIKLQVFTSQPSICTINRSDINSLIQLSARPMYNGGTNNKFRFSDYTLGHNYTLDYTGRGITGGTFDYTINCTNLAQLSSSSTATTRMEIDNSPPVVTIDLDDADSFFTLKRYTVTCSDHCTDTYMYKVISPDAACGNSGYSSGVPYDNIIEVTGEKQENNKICVIGRDVLGRETLAELNVTVEPFNNGILNVNYPYQYSDRSLFKTYSPKKSFTLNISTVFPAECRYIRNDLVPKPKNSDPAYIYSIATKFTDTGNDSDISNSVTVHSTDININPAQNTEEVWYIICNATNVDESVDRYIRREAFMYWDDSSPYVNVTVPSRVYDWNNHTSITIKVATDDDTMCVLNDSRNLLIIDNGSDTNYNSYVKSRTYNYDLIHLLTASELDDLNTLRDLSFNVSCVNRAKLWQNALASTHYELDKSVVVSRTSSDVFTTTSIPIKASTNIMSNCSVSVDGVYAGPLASTNRIDHTGTVSVSSGQHVIDVVCNVPENSNIASGHNIYTAYYDAYAPNVTLTPINGVDGLFTCNLETFSVNIDMSDDTGIIGYNYWVTGPGISLSNPKFVSSGTSDTITYTGALVDGGTYVVRATAVDRANRTSGAASLAITAHSPVAGIACDSRPPIISSSIDYFGSVVNNGANSNADKSVAIVNVSCTDINDPTNNVSASGCTNLFNYSFMPNQDDCRGASYSSTGEYRKLLIFFNDAGTLCIQGRDAAGYNAMTSAHVDINPITCGNGVIESKPSRATLGMPTAGPSGTFNNWNSNAYDMLPDEECDGASSIDYLNESCLTEGFVGGSLSCNNICRIDKSSCDSGMPVWIIDPRPFGIGTNPSYTLTGGSGYDSLCRYGLLVDNKNITKSYDALVTNMNADVNGVVHTTPISGAADISTYMINSSQFQSRDIVCKMYNIPAGFTGKIEQTYGLAKVYEGYDSSSPVITISTNKPGDTVYDYNDRLIDIRVATDDDTICTISDSSSMFIDALMDGSFSDFNSYGKLHQVTANYSGLPYDAIPPYDDARDITYNVNCTNRAGLSSYASIVAHYNIIHDIIMTKIAPINNYTSGSVASYHIQTNVLSTCVISNGASAASVITMSGVPNTDHYANIGVDSGWNNIRVVCTNGGHAAPADQIFRIYGRANAPIDPVIITDSRSCGLSSINFQISAKKTSMDIASFYYNITDVNTGSNLVFSSAAPSTQTSDGYDAADIAYSVAGGLIEDHNYKITAYAVDTLGHASNTTWVLVDATTANIIACDHIAPVMNIVEVPTGYPDITRASVTCSDTLGSASGAGDSGCTNVFYYSLISPVDSCDNLTYPDYSRTGSYAQLLTITNNGLIGTTTGTTDTGKSKLCVRGSDRNDNLAYAQGVFNLANNNYINITPISPLSIYPNVVVTTKPVTNITLSTSIDANCRYSLTAPSGAANIAALYSSYTPFNITGSLRHTIINFDTQWKYEQFMDVICSSNLASNPYSRMTLRIVYVDTIPAIQLTLDPDTITDWNSRTTELGAATNVETVCSIDSNYGPHDGLSMGNSSDATTYAISHYLDLNYDVSTLNGIYAYTITCRNLAGQSNISMIQLEYNLSNVLDIELVSQTYFITSSIELVAVTNLNSSCRLYLDAIDRGIMDRDSTDHNHLTTISGLTNGIHHVDIECSTPIRNLRGTANYNITINASSTQGVPGGNGTIAAGTCGDGMIQTPNKAGVNEDCDCGSSGSCTSSQLNGRTCNSGGFSGYDYIGGVLRCSSTCKYDMTNCDNGKGYCGNGKLDGPNTNGVYEQCDGHVPSGLSCEDYGFDGGTLGCTDRCIINTSRCTYAGITSTNNPICGNRIVENGEQCEYGANYSNMKCSMYGYDGGAVTCDTTSKCLFIMSGCYFNNDNNNNGGGSSKRCGDGTIDKPDSAGLYEQCDGNNLPNGIACQSLGFKSGSIHCTGCMINTSNCLDNSTTGTTTSPVCNNGKLESGESCDPSTNYDSILCSTFGYSGGKISCTNRCIFNLGNCENSSIITTTRSICGDGKIDKPDYAGLYEQCDGTNIPSGITCSDFGFKSGSGSISCGGNCLINTSKCVQADGKIGNMTSTSPKCSNDILESGEQCELNANYSTIKCSIFGYSGGTISCTNRCIFDLKSCLNSTLGDVTTGLTTHCSNKVKDPDTETDIDCGGECNGCALNKTCRIDNDCKSNKCISGRCAVDPCTNGVLDIGEEDIDCGGNCDACPAPESNPVKLPLMIVGIISTLGSAGYIIYRTFIEKKPMNARPPMGGTGGTPTPPMAPMGPVKLTPEEVEMARKQHEAMLKKRQLRAKDREDMLSSLDEDSTGKDAKSKDGNAKDKASKDNKYDDELKPLELRKGKYLEGKADAEGYVDLSKSDSKDKDAGKKDTFNKLREIGKGKTLEKNEKAKTKDNNKVKEEKSEKSLGEADRKAEDTAKNIAKLSGENKDSIKPKISGSDTLNHKDALKLFGEMSKDKVMSAAFKDTLSSLLASGKIDKDNVSKILFEYMDNGLLAKSDVARISSELKII